ncbi:Transcription factor [Penicillium capsulatum]|nr:Transcription factor [Penicillium capsulatum]
MFSHREMDSETDAAFLGALTILRMLAQQSSQAAHYLEILTLLESAVTQQRSSLNSQARQRRSQYVSRIFSLNEEPATPDSRFEREECHNDASVSLHGGPLYPWIPHEGGAALLDWDGMDLPLWDSFPFTEPGSTVL